MMDIFQHLLLGFSVVLTVQNLLACFVGVTLGTIVGVLPGIGPAVAIAIILPHVGMFSDVSTSLIMLAGVYYGAQYGGSTTSILLGIPGEPSNVATIADGHAMSKNGSAATALAAAAIASFIAGTVSVFFIAAFAETIALAALAFGPSEYTAVLLLGLTASTLVSSKSLLDSWALTLVGILLGLVGTQVMSGTERFTLGVTHLINGLSFSVLALGVFGVAELMWLLIANIKPMASPQQVGSVMQLNISKLTRTIFPASLRGTFVGSILGVLPGAGSILPTFLSYALEKRLSKNPENFGQGEVRGVAGPEAANNAGAQTSFIPMLSLGLPVTSVMALIIGALMSFNIQPGPHLISNNGTMFWALIASMWIGNALLLILNLPLAHIWAKLLLIPPRLLSIVMIALCIFGAYSLNQSWIDVIALIPLVLLGIFLKRAELDPLPLTVGFVIGPMFEENAQRALIVSHYSWNTFTNSAISMVILSIVVIATLLKLKGQNSGTKP